MLFSVFSFGLYEVYWFYRNWKAIKTSQLPGIWPIPRAIFAVFFCYDLFKRVLHSAKENGYTETYSATWLATAYIIMLIVSSVWNRMDSLGAFDLVILAFLLFVTPLILFPIQRAINFNNAQLGAPAASDGRFSVGEVILLVVGSALMLVVLWAFLATA